MQEAKQKAAELPRWDDIAGSFQPLLYEIHDFEQEHPVYRLYDLEDDPCETTDLATAHPDKVAEIRELVNRYRTSSHSAPRPSGR